nr:hypothetical protein [Acidimicrobiia bacterium]
QHRDRQEIEQERDGWKDHGRYPDRRDGRLAGVLEVRATVNMGRDCSGSTTGKMLPGTLTAGPT